MKSIVVTLSILVMAVGTFGCAQFGDFLGGFLSNPVVVKVLEECGDLPAEEFDACAVFTIRNLVDPNEVSISDYLKLAQELQDATSEDVEVPDDVK